MDEIQPDDVVISGISGLFPKCDDIKELEDNLKRKVYMVSEPNDRMPIALGKLKNAKKFDAGYFGLKPDYADAMDPMGRMLLEKSYEAIIDSGYNPESQRGRNVGVFVGVFMSETEIAYYSCGSSEGLGITGITRSFLANRISYCLGLHGPSFSVDTACSSSMYALQMAYRAIKNNECESAIVGGCNLCLNNGITAQLLKVGLLSTKGKSSVLDERGDGYVRSESVSAIFLQKASAARRIYATVVHAKLNCDGYKPEGITYPSCITQKQLLREFYDECNIAPSKVDWVELHATGTRAGDREEIKAVEIFCENRDGPLPVGSVKSNMGHAEAASTLCSLAKVIIAIRGGYITPNLNYETPRQDIDALHNGMIKVITENTPWNGGLVGVNSFGLGGANGHTLLRSFKKRKSNSIITDDLPRIVVVSGRTEEAVNVLISNLLDNPIDVEYVGLLQQIHSEDIPRHLHRGYVILYQDKPAIKDIQHCAVHNRPIWYVFAGMGCQWPGMAKTLMNVPLFSKSIQECHVILRKKNLDLIHIITDDDPTIFDNLLHTFVATIAIQIAFVDMMATLNIDPAGVIGHSAGEVACAYAVGCLTKEQTLLCSYYRGKACLECNLTKGAMAAIGLSPNELKSRCPPTIDIACYNSPNNCTIAGPMNDVRQICKVLESEDIFAREVNSSNAAFHSRYVDKAVSIFLDYLKPIISDLKVRSPKWISTSTTVDDASNLAEYMANNMRNPVQFYEATKAIPPNAIVVELSPHGLLAAVMKQCTTADYIPLAKKDADGVEFLLKAIGKLFLTGATPHLHRLYPPVEYPVSVDTRMVAPLVRWQHDRDWSVVFTDEGTMGSGERTVTLYTKGSEYQFLFGHVIDGRTIMPGTGLLFIIWESISMLHGKMQSKTSVVFEKLHFRRVVHLHKDRNINFLTHIQKCSGNFEISESGQLVLSGRVYIPDDIDKEMIDTPKLKESEDEIELTTDDIYKEFTLRGHGYTGLFRQILKCNTQGTKAFIKWNENWVAFLDTVMQMYIQHADTRVPCLLASIDKIIINMKEHTRNVQNISDSQSGWYSGVTSFDNNNGGIPAYGHKELNIIECGGVQVKGVKGVRTPRRKLKKTPDLLVHKFTPLINIQRKIDRNELACFCSCIIWQNTVAKLIKIVEHNKDKELISPILAENINKYPYLQAIVFIVSTKSAPDNLPTDLNITFCDDKSFDDHNAHLMIFEEEPTPDQLLQISGENLAEGGFVLIRKSENVEPRVISNFSLCAEILYENEKLILLRKTSSCPDEPLCVNITDTFEWIVQLQEETNDVREIILYAQDDNTSGILGFYNCLKKEIPTRPIKCFFIRDRTAPKFSLTDRFYKQQYVKNLNVNIYQNGHWGCYVHYPLKPNKPVQSCHAFVNVGQVGDLRTLNWFQGNANQLAQNITHDSKFIHVYYSALNFKDVLLATGTLAYDDFIKNRLMQECVIGCEFSGRDNDGKRYMGMYPSGAISTVLMASVQFMWEIPNYWSLEDAATVPIVYLTVIAAFFQHGQLKKGDSVLIHSGAGGVGQAAINVASFYQCTIFTTVGTPEKHQFIKKKFPHIADSHIGNSRDTSFEQLVLRETGGKGVDLVLNSLAEDKLQASIQCLAEGGRFLEIGKLDLLKDNKIGMKIFLKGISFHCILLDKIHEEKEETRSSLFRLFQRELKSGSIKPLDRTIFDSDDLESAFRYMMTGKHVGKILIRVREEEKQLYCRPEIMIRDAIPRFSCERHKVYVICGGLGGMGIEFADWLVLRGARKIILTSRAGVKNGYQRMRIDLWKSYGAAVIVSTLDVTIYEHVKALITEANKLGPVSAIFNLAAVTYDKMFNSQDATSFNHAVAPKCRATRHLDEVSRVLCPHLERFVVFSSISCGLGNTAQTNYGFANSSCERICERRRADGLPALAIQWGAIGDVGMLDKFDDVEKMFGLKKQPIRSCLNIMDQLLCSAETIVTSYITADKGNAENATNLSLVGSIANILGIQDLKTISMYSPLPELGMDSISGLEVKQLLEHQFDIFLSPKEIISLTFAQLDELQRTGKKGVPSVTNDNNTVSTIPYVQKALLTNPKGLDLFNVEPLVKLDSLITETEEAANTVFLFPSLDGLGGSMEKLAKNLHMHVYCFQYYGKHENNPIVKQAEYFASLVCKIIPPMEEFRLTGYAYGALMALECAQILLAVGRHGRIVLIEGSVEFAKSLKTLYFEGADQSIVQNKVITDVVGTFRLHEINEQFQKQLNEKSDWESKLEYVFSRIINLPYSKESLRIVINYLYNRFQDLMRHHFHHVEKLNVKATLIKAKKVMFDLPDNVGLQYLFVDTTKEHFVNETHFTILDNVDTAKIIENALVD